MHPADTGIGGGDIWMLKLSATGAIEWKRNAGSESADVGNSVEVMADSAYLVTGYVSAGNGDVTEFHGQGDYWLVKMSRTGDIEWEKCMGNLGNENATSGQQLSDGSFVVAGHATLQYADWPGTTGGKIEMFIVKLSVANEVKNSGYTTTISLSPNPVTDNFVIEGGDNVRVIIQNLAGKEVLETNRRNVSLAHTPAGLYLVSVYDDNGMLLKREKVLKL